MFTRYFAFSAFIFNFAFTLSAQDSSFIKIHFLYGSKPAKEFKDVERKWFGGIHGGHVGVEIDSDQILNFLPAGDFHVLAHGHKKHSHFTIYNQEHFYSMFGAESDSVTKMMVMIPVSAIQKDQFDSIAATYLEETPYDYAFIGMRCGSAAYNVLAQAGIFKQKSEMSTAIKIFYPKLLRNKLLKLAEENHWKVIRSNGSQKRKWERD